MLTIHPGPPLLAGLAAPEIQRAIFIARTPHFRAGLVQQSVQIAATRNLTLFVGAAVRARRRQGLEQVGNEHHAKAHRSISRLSGFHRGAVTVDLLTSWPATSGCWVRRPCGAIIRCTCRRTTNSGSRVSGLASRSGGIGQVVLAPAIGPKKGRLLIRQHPGDRQRLAGFL